MSTGMHEECRGPRERSSCSQRKSRFTLYLDVRLLQSFTNCCVTRSVSSLAALMPSDFSPARQDALAGLSQPRSQGFLRLDQAHLAFCPRHRPSAEMRPESGIERPFPLSGLPVSRRAEGRSQIQSALSAAMPSRKRPLEQRAPLQNTVCAAAGAPSGALGRECSKATKVRKSGSPEVRKSGSRKSSGYKVSKYPK
eukprot:scaffold48_cov311-Pinguiococcus_pyrenoidosus.AAC.157